MFLCHSFLESQTRIILGIYSAYNLGLGSLWYIFELVLTLLDITFTFGVDFLMTTPNYTLFSLIHTKFSLRIPMKDTSKFRNLPELRCAISNKGTGPKRVHCNYTRKVKGENRKIGLCKRK